MLSADKRILFYHHMVMSQNYLIFRDFDYKYNEFLKCIKNNYYDLLKLLILSSDENDIEKIVSIAQHRSEYHPLTYALKNAKEYSSNDQRLSSEIPDQEKRENEKAINIVYLLMSLYNCEGREVVDEVRKSYTNNKVSKWLNLSDLYYECECRNDTLRNSCDTNKIINKIKDFKYVLDNFEEFENTSLISPQENQREWLECITRRFENIIKRSLTNSELYEFYEKINKINEEDERMNSEQEMKIDSTLEEWLVFVNNLKQVPQAL
jgi:hypothetical protein